MKPIYRIFLCIALALSFSSCEEFMAWLEEGTEEEEVDTTTSQWSAQVNFNPTDAQILTATNKDGNLYAFLGTKDSQGNAKEIKQLVCYMKGESEPTEFTYENNRIKQIVCPNGVTMTLDWVTSSKIALTMVEPNTNEQLNTAIDLDGSTNGIPAYTAPTNTQLAPRSGNLELKIESGKAPEGSSLMSRAGTNKTGKVTVTRCNAPGMGYDVYVNLWQQIIPGGWDHTVVSRAYAEHVGNGVYEYDLPEEYQHKTEQLQKRCEKLVEIIGYVCDANTLLNMDASTKVQFCAAVAGALASGVVSTPVAAAFLTGCSAASFAVEGLCTVASLGATTAPNMPTLYDGLCKILKESDYENKFVLEPCVNATPKRISGTCWTHYLGKDLPDLSVDMGGTTEISKFTLSPSAPSVGSSYTATADILCGIKDSKVTVSVVGTDGYTDSKTETISETKPYYSITLKVPGAKLSEVRDVCTIEVVTPNGEVFTKTASLVFK